MQCTIYRDCGAIWDTNYMHVCPWYVLYKQMIVVPKEERLQLKHVDPLLPFYRYFVFTALR